MNIRSNQLEEKRRDTLHRTISGFLDFLGLAAFPCACGVCFFLSSPHLHNHSILFLFIACRAVVDADMNEGACNTQPTAARDPVFAHLKPKPKKRFGQKKK